MHSLIKAGQKNGGERVGGGPGRAGEELGCGQQEQRGAGRCRRTEGLHGSWGLQDEGAETTARFQKWAEKGWGLEIAEREEESGFRQVLGVLGKEIKNHLQINTGRNRGTEATPVFLPH